MSEWITIEAERVLYVERGRDVIVCDRGHPGPVTLLVKVAKAVTQLFVVRAPKRSATYVFNNHEAALRCRRELKLNSDNMTGCVVFDDWRDGEPVRSAAMTSAALGKEADGKRRGS